MAGDINSGMDENMRRYYLDVMGIQCWEPINRDTGGIGHDSLSTENNVTTLYQLDTAVQQCTKCRFHSSRKQAITGRGSGSSGLMFVLLAPDINDDNAGMLCSGESNELFMKMLAAINVSINDVYITSLIKCYTALPESISSVELDHCSEHLHQQISLIQPGLVVVLGEAAVRYVAQNNLPLDELREIINNGTRQGKTAIASGRFEQVPLFASYSPQELLLQPANKRKAWQDLQQIQKIIEAW